MKRPFLIIIITFLITRLINLTLLPIFNDESSYLDWGWRAIHLGVPFHSLYDAKQPLYIWLYGIFQTFISDPLIAGRLVSVFTGLVTLFGIWKLCLYLFDKKTAIWSTIAYCLTPIFFFYDRQALFETAIVAMGIWSAYFLLRLIDTPRLKFALALGAVFAYGFWIKTSALLFILPVCLVYLIYSLQSSSRNWRLTLGIYMLMFTLILLSPLLFQTQFWSTFLSTNSQYSFSLSQILHFPLVAWGHNLIANLDIAFFQLSPPIFLLALIGIFISLKSRTSHSQLLFLLLLIPALLETLSVKNPSARYLVAFLYLFPVYAGLALSRFPVLGITLAIPAIMIAVQTINPPLYFQYLSRFTKNSAREVYICCSFTGYPTLSAMKYVKSLPQNNRPVFVGSFLSPGNPPSALFAYYRNNPLIHTGYLDSQLFGKSLDGVDCLTADLPVYYLGQNHYQAGFDRFLTPVKDFVNPFGSEESVTLYRLKSDCPSGKSQHLNLTK